MMAFPPGALGRARDMRPRRGQLCARTASPRIIAQGSLRANYLSTQHEVLEARCRPILMMAQPDDGRGCATLPRRTFRSDGSCPGNGNAPNVVWTDVIKGGADGADRSGNARRLLVASLV